MAETLTRMKADSFRARLRLGLGFVGPVHIPEALTLRDSAITYLCDTLCVDGDLDLKGCVNLAALPRRLIVRGRLRIDGCARITSLPTTLRELFGLSARGCHGLTSVAPLVECHRSLILTGCTAMEPLSPELRVKGKVSLDNCRVDHDTVFIKTGAMPETVRIAAVGRKIGDTLDHPVLAGHPLLGAVITEAVEMEPWDGVFFYTDTSALIIPASG